MASHTPRLAHASSCLTADISSWAIGKGCVPLWNSALLGSIPKGEVAITRFRRQSMSWTDGQSPLVSPGVPAQRKCPSPEKAQPLSSHFPQPRWIHSFSRLPFASNSAIPSCRTAAILRPLAPGKRAPADFGEEIRRVAIKFRILRVELKVVVEREPLV